MPNDSITIPEGTWPITVKDFDGEVIDAPAYLEAHIYATGHGAAIGIYIYDKEFDDFELFDYITCNVPGAFLMNPETDIIVNHNLYEDNVQAVIDAGFIKEQSYTQVRSGFVMMPVHEMTDEAIKWFYSRPEVMEVYGQTDEG